jgi:hemolysin III
MPPVAFALLVAGGAAFTVAAFVYLLRWPDPAPATFGYHEVFHAIIIAGCACHFASVAVCVTR